MVTALDTIFGSIFPPYGLYSNYTGFFPNGVTNPTQTQTDQFVKQNPYEQPSLTPTVGLSGSFNLAPGIADNLSDWVKNNTNVVLILISLIGLVMVVVPAFTGRTGRR